jgi:hypothetical protein
MDCNQNVWILGLITLVVVVILIGYKMSSSDSSTKSAFSTKYSRDSNEYPYKINPVLPSNGGMMEKFKSDGGMMEKFKSDYTVLEPIRLPNVQGGVSSTMQNPYLGSLPNELVSNQDTWKSII